MKKEIEKIIDEMKQEIDIVELKMLDEENDDYDIWVNRRILESISYYYDKLKKLNVEAVSEEKKCDCTHTQACEICASSKDIDWESLGI